MLIHQQIELQAARTPDAVAARDAGRTLTYAELDQHANRCARYLRELGVGPDVIVGLSIERSLEMIVALLGIMKAGGAYLPLDPAFPEARRAFVLDDSAAPVVVTQPGLADAFAGFAGTVLALDLGADVLAGYDGGALAPVNVPDDLAYVIYTSGSTGQPKGCMLSHRAVCNRLVWMQDAYRLTARDRVLQKTPYTFDVSVWEFFWPLIAGATLVFAKPSGHKDSRYLTETIRREGITVCHFVPSMLRFFLDDPAASQCTSLRDVFTSGEALPFELVRRFGERVPARLHNLYGPTEAAVDVSHWTCEIRADKRVPIGRAITGIRLHVLDDTRAPVARGDEGELYIAGVGLARGYLNRPELTDERFVPNPFGGPGERMYRTGDRVRELDDGNLEFVGRIDFQVKLRGLRVELGEVEAVLRDCPGVNDAVVLVRGEAQGDPKLVAYVEPDGKAPDARTVRAFARTRLPEYMVPNLVAVLDRLPVTVHGKLDRQALPWPVAGDAAARPVEAAAAPPAPVAPIASRRVDTLRDALSTFVATLLQRASVDGDADLFELGATSLTLVRLAEWIRDEYGVEVPVDRFLDTPTTRGIADYIAGAGGDAGGADVNATGVEAPADPAAALPAGTSRPVADPLRAFVAALLNCGTLDDDADWFDLGATSLSLIRVAEWLFQTHRVEVPVDTFLDTPNLRGIVAYLHAHGVTDARAASPSEPEAARAPTATPTPDAVETTPLPVARLRADAYLPPAPIRFANRPLEFAAFGAWLMRLGADERDGRLCYLHPSGGGLNAVRTYVAVKPQAVSGLAGGVYYFHPVAHTLHRVGEIAAVDRHAFADTDRAAFDSAALAVFFVAALDAVTPLYPQHAGVLVAVEAGYMAQLLLGRQAASGLAARPAVRVDFGRLAAAFDLAGDERFVHCLLAGAAPGEPDPATADERVAMIDRVPPPPASTATLSHRALSETVAQAPLSKAALEQLHDAHRHLRDVSALPAVCRLAAAPSGWDDYRLRACRRDYEPAPLSLRALGGLLTLLRPGPGAAPAYLYGSAAGKPGFRVYLYARGERVEGLTEGLYAYDDARHALTRQSDLDEARMAQAYSPYNRRHYRGAAFCLFLVAAPHAGLDDEEAIHLPLLDAGCLGQLLMERQAEFEIGLCPIGGMRFDVVRDSLQLGADATLLHSFTGGIARQPVPAAWRWQSDAAPALESLVEPVHAPARPGARDALAIVGLSGRYPGAADAGALWDNLRAGVSSIAPLPAERAALLAREPVPAIRAGGYLTQIDCFDNLLFGISAVEARALDPQERLLLETAWACLEDAGYTADALLRQNPRVGVFVGAMWNDYQSHGVQAWEREGRIEEFSHHASLANRLSYCFNFSGPSIAVNTSCSSGMTALHLACESIRRGECEAALVGGVNLLSHAYHARLLEAIDFLSKEDACRPFSANANGWVLGEGVGVVLIKRHDAALRDRDHVYARILGSAIGHSGRTGRFGAPSAPQQEAAIRRALDDAGLAAGDIDYVEAAASGAGMADAVEMRAVRAVFAGRDAAAPCQVGTVKANIGHLESASVFSQLTKVLYQLRDRQLAPSLNSEPRSPLIALDGTGVRIVDALAPWRPAQPGRPLRALVNVIGAAGSEGHLVLEEAGADPRGPARAAPALVPLSAATGAQLRQRARQLLDWLARAPAPRLDDLAWTLQVGRVAMDERLAFVVPDCAALGDALRAYLAADEGAGAPPDTWRGRARHDADAASATDDLVALARDWVRGSEVDWHARASGDARRIALPVYPFERIRHWIGQGGAAAVAAARVRDGMTAGTAAHAGADVEALRDPVRAHLVGLVAEVTEVPAERLDVDAPLERYGLTSLMIEAMNVRLEAMFGPLSKTLFFEVRTLRQLAGHIVEHHGEAAARAFGVAWTGAAARVEPARVARDAAASDAIAVIGLSGRYPRARSLHAFWDNLREGVDCIGEVPPQRWDHARYFDTERGKPGKTYSKWGGFIDGVDEFDPLFFGVTPGEAGLMDPQERLFLQTAWQAVEDAGYTRDSLRATLASRVGVFVGVMYGEYQLHASLPGGLALSGTYGTIANRVSYVLGLRGPSMAVDTLCSSSLTALHLACESIRRGECDAALAGGVCLSLHPNKYATHALFGMAASDGRCRSFGAGGDGFVPGEGVGAVLLKPLSRAIADGDVIHGVIRGTAVNHGGRTNGYTVPDPRAQAELVRDALARAGVQPREVSYIEAHGTGTALGDPIEIAGLAQAFGEAPDTPPYCAIGSVKSNIGHGEAAAGIAGLTKVLLQMRHQTLVKSLHSETLNASLDLARTPFVVQSETKPWPRPRVTIGAQTREGARIAGISSFGAGGANAHVVVEEYVAPEAAGMPVTPERPVAIVLSARTDDALREQASQLRAAIAAGVLRADNLAAAAYTLQVGREAMEERLALRVDSVEQLDERLAGVVDGRGGIDGHYRGQVRRGTGMLAVWTADEDLSAALDAWIAKGKLAKLLALWVQGFEFDWNRLYPEGAPRRISLPTYPFARERYWVPQAAASHGAAPGAAQAALHPLLQRNTSGLSGARFSARFAGDEGFLARHGETGERVLPGAAGLEMVREALVQAGGVEAGGGVRLREVAWARPVSVGAQPVEVHVGLYPLEDGTVEFDVSDGSDEVHCEGTVEALAAPGERLDLDALRAQCGRERLDGEACAAVFAASGLAGSPAWLAIEQILIGEDCALARLSLSPDGLAEAGFVLHPGVLDAVLQIGERLAEPGRAPRRVVPLAADEVDLAGPCVRRMWAWVVREAGPLDGGADARARRYDIALCDDEGAVRVRINGCESREAAAAAAEAGPPARDERPASGRMLLQPVWRAQAATGIAPDYAARVVLLGDVGVTAQALAARMGGVTCIALPAAGDLAGSYRAAVRRVIGELQALARSRPSSRVLVQVVVPAHGEGAVLAGLSGLLKSAYQEQPRLVGQLIGVGADEDVAGLAAKLQENAGSPSDAAIRYAEAGREVGGWRELETEPEAVMPWTADGVYLLTGGLGGLGRLLAEEIARRAPGATLILTGRRALDEAGRAQLRALEALGATVEYRALDVADGAAVRRVVLEVQEAHQGLNGIVHAAGVLRDGPLLDRTDDAIDAVLAPKVAGLVNLDEASREIELDWLIAFSSTSGALGAVGLADYAAANGFMDGFAHYRNALAARGLRHGRTVSIDWPLWRDGGMRIDAASARQLEALTGFTALERETGMRALYSALGAGLGQVMVLHGDLTRIRQGLNGAASARAAAGAAQSAGVPAPEASARVAAVSRDQAVAHFKQLLAQVFQLPPTRIDAGAPLETYGINSILVVQLTSELEKTFGPLSKTLLFEYQTLDALVDYFVASHGARLATLLQPAASAPPRPAAAAPRAAHLARAMVRGRRSAITRRASPAAAARAANRDIAIIGVAGRYPQARDLRTFWDNLRAGRDSITEIPPERWEHGRYFDADKGKSGTVYSKWGGFIDGVDEFDPQFFNISPREAMFMDPQERLFLQCAHAALEDAGYPRDALERGARRRNVGVYVGTTHEEYQLYGVEEQARGHFVALSGAPASIANRVSYHFNLHGPSLSVDTMCSSSLTALHLACESLLNGRCEMAIAGGVNLTLHPNKYLALAQGRFASTDGRCRSFGDGGDGYVPAEGVGAVILKPLDQAIADGDPIHGVIKASALNHGGKNNGYTVPNPQAQAEVIARALRDAGIDARTLSYLEAHGTGTSLGDPIEIAGLSKAFGEFTQDRQFCAIGSVKSNIGHCESAAGIAGITKVLLQMKHGELAPSLHAQTPNPHIDFSATPFVLQRELGEWRRPVVEVAGQKVEMPRRAGISSFGAGGSNAHVVIEEYREAQARREPHPVTAEAPALVVLSARDEARLRERVRDLVEAIEAQGWGDAQLPDLAYTLQVGREEMEERLALAVGGMAELARKLSAYLAGDAAIDALYRGQVRRNKETMAVFSADDELQEAIAKWVARGKFAKVLDLWVKGMAFDWGVLYGADRPKRMSLPTYPFARERVWLDRHAIMAGFAPDATTPPATTPSAAPAPVPAQRAQAPSAVSLFAPVWQPAHVAHPDTPATGSDGVLIVGGTSLQQEMLQRQLGHAQVADFASGAGIEEIADALLAHDAFAHLIWIVPDASWPSVADEQLIAAQHDGVLHGFRLVKALLAAGYGTKPLEWSVLTTRTQAVADGDTLAPAHAGVHGLIGVLAKEYPNWKVRLVDLPVDAGWPFDAVLGLPADPDGNSWAWRAGQWYRQHLLPVEVAELPQPQRAHRRGGVYVVIGGAGGIGEAWSEQMVRAHGAQIVWIGRRPLDAAIQARIDRMARVGPAPHYVAADASERAALEQARDAIRARFGAIHGVVHSALVLADQALANLDEARFAASLTAKVDVSVRLAQVFGDEPLDFVLFFSSLQSFSRVPGQGNYAAGCAFKDAFARHLGRHWTCPVKVMNWGWWGSVGVAAAPAYEARMTRLGLASIEPGEGWAALEQLLGGPHDQLVAVKTAAAPRARAALATASASAAATPVDVTDDAQLRRLGVAAFKQLVGDLLHIPAERLDPAESLAAYGIDSISVTQLCGLLGGAFADVNQALFFDCRTIDELVAHFLGTQRAALAAWVAGNAAAPAGGAVDAVAEAAAGAPGVVADEPPDASPDASADAVAPARPAAVSHDIAIIGLACRFPGADSTDAYWRMLLDGAQADNRGPVRRWPERHAGADSTAPQSWGAFLDDVGHFDPCFFGIPPLHADAIDPQERLFLMSCWHALEDAGYAGDARPAQPARADDEVGVFVGVTAASYNLIGFEQTLAGRPRITTLSFASIANRVSHALGLSGPSLAVDTMCSSSLVALHMACESLRRGECAMALAGGVNLNLHPARLDAMAQGKLICEDGESRSFGAGGKGFLAAEGVAAVVLKPLADARRDGDVIHAVIKGSAVGHGGTTLNYFAPSARGQGRVIAKALDHAGVAPDQVAYVEMQCTGDEATDAAEFDAIKAGYRTGQRAGAPLRLGSVKPNVGHAEAAAGMAQLIKAVLQLRHRTLVRTLTRDTTNPQCHFDGANVAIQTAVEALPDASDAGGPLCMAVNAMGAGGTAAHLIIAAGGPSSPARDTRDGATQVVVLSARSRVALRRSAASLAGHLERVPEGALSLADLAYTLRVGRRTFRHRLAIVADTIDAVRAALRDAQQDDGRVDDGRLFMSPQDGATAGAGHDGATWAADDARDEAAGLIELARRWTAGMPVDGFAWCGAGRRVSLPGYPFELRAYWPGEDERAGDAHAVARPADVPAQAARAPVHDTPIALLQSVSTPDDARAHVGTQIDSIAEHMHLMTVGILYVVMSDKGVVFDERQGPDGGFALYPRPAQPLGAAASRVLERLLAGDAGVPDVAAGGLLQRLGARTMTLAGRLAEVWPTRTARKSSNGWLALLPGGEGLMAAYLLKLLEKTPYLVTDANGARLALPDTIRSRKALDALRGQYEINLRALPEYQSYCELLAGIVSGMLEGARPGPEQVAEAGALLVDLFTAPSKLAFLNRLTAELCMTGRLAGRTTLSVLAIGAGGFEVLASMVAAAPRDTRITYQVVSGWSQIATGVAELGHERFPGVAFSSCAPQQPGALAEHVGERRFDVVIVNTQDPCAREAVALFDTPSGAARAGLVFVTAPVETRSLALLLDLTGMWPSVAARDALADARALDDTLARAGYRRQVVAAPVLTVFSRDAASPAPGVDAARLAEIRAVLSAIFADALPDDATLDPHDSLADAGIPSMSWALIFAKLQQRFGPQVEPGMFAEAGDALSIESLAQRLAGMRAGDDAPPPVPDDLGERVMQRLVDAGRAEAPLADASRATRGVFTSARGQVYEYFEQGSGPALIFLSALAFSQAVWSEQVHAFGDRYRLIFPHLPGHAGSTPTAPGFSFETLADELVELMDALDVREAHLVGWCVAGNVAQLLALRHPRRLASLALVCTTPTDARMRGITREALEDYSESPLLSYQIEFNNIYHEEFLAPEVTRSLAIIRQAHVPVESQALLGFIGSLFSFDTRGRLGEIAAPTLIVAGSHDIAFPIDQVALLKDGIRHARFVMFEKGGHLPFLNQSESFNETLRAFLADVEAGGRVPAIALSDG
ncbi:amino acid adenylation domain-containing protein [Burkholderia ubonensis]|uniref:Non-ribosomal peptide synthetase n=1 Tax=Burkholderia ubonensis TaxID=101571 RepID=A0A1R1JHA8_9BURK|nr:amino acid adenylation domain-containing protein [Burkholderia ubonensis]OMG74766.1 hypothetical protein BW685_03145 [Burkholderia ubonensis]